MLASFLIIALGTPGTAASERALAQTPAKSPSPAANDGKDKVETVASARKHLDDTLAAYRKFVDETGPKVLALVDKAVETLTARPGFSAESLQKQLDAFDRARASFLYEGKWPTSVDPKIGAFSRESDELRYAVRQAYERALLAATRSRDDALNAQLSAELAAFKTLNDIAPWHSILLTRATYSDENSDWHKVGFKVHSPDHVGAPGDETARPRALGFKGAFPAEYELRLVLHRTAGSGALELCLPWTDDSTFVAQLDCGAAPVSADGKTPPDEHTVAIVVHADDCSVRLDDRAPVSWRKGEPFPWSVNGSGEGERALSLVAVDPSTRLWVDDVQLKCLARSRAR